MSVAASQLCPMTYKAPSGHIFSCLLPVGHPGEHSHMKEGSGVTWEGPPAFDAINHPKHYNSHPSGIECITIAEHHNFNIGCVFKYLWRAGLKGPEIDVTTHSDSERKYVLGTPSSSAGLTDLKKAKWYLDREISRLEGKHAK